MRKILAVFVFALLLCVNIPEGASAAREVGWKYVTTKDAANCAIKMDGSLWCWGGWNINWLIPTDKMFVSTPHKLLDGKVIEQIALGQGHACAIDKDKLLYCWGRNDNGQIGNGLSGANMIVQTPTQVNKSYEYKVIAVAVGSNFTCAIDNYNRLWLFGKLGWQSQNSPVVKLKNDTGYQLLSVAVSGTDIYILTDKGIVKTSSAPISSLTVFSTEKDWSSISATDSHVCAKDAGDALWCWGDNEFGQLGIGNFVSQAAPSKVGVSTRSVTVLPRQLDLTWRSFNLDESRTCGVNKNGILYCWGIQFNSDLSNWDQALSGQASSPNPVAVESFIGVNNWISVSTGYTHACAINQDNLMRCWGNNDFGQLGVGDGPLQSMYVTTPN